MKKTNLIVKVKNPTWYGLKIIAQEMELSRDEAVELALSEFVKKHYKFEHAKLMRGL